MIRWSTVGLLTAVLALHCGEEYEEPFYPWPAQPPRYVDVEPDWSPDGTTIAFRHRVDEIWLLDLASGERTYLTRGGWPTWSPDGRMIAYAGLADRNIHVIDVESKQISRLTDWEWCCYPTWSPDGTRIAFDVIVPVDSAGIWIMSAQGEGLTRIVAGRAPDWSPDGLRLVFVQASAEDAPYDEITLVGLEEASVVRLTDNRLDDRHPQWSPDGQKIAYASIMSPASSPYTGVWVMNADGGRQRQLASSPYAVRAAWSPDGTKIIYEGLNEDSWTITLWIMNADGSDQRPLTLPAG